MYVLELRDTAFGHIRDAFDYYEMNYPGWVSNSCQSWMLVSESSGTIPLPIPF